MKRRPTTADSFVALGEEARRLEEATEKLFASALVLVGTAWTDLGEANVDAPQGLLDCALELEKARAALFEFGEWYASGSWIQEFEE